MRRRFYGGVNDASQCNLAYPELRAAWQHEYGDAYPIDSQFASGAGGLFTVHGPTIGRISALLSTGVSVQWNERVSAYVC